MTEGLKEYRGGPTRITGRKGVGKNECRDWRLRRCFWVLSRGGAGAEPGCPGGGDCGGEVRSGDQSALASGAGLRG